MSLSIENGANLYYKDIPIYKVYEGDSEIWVDTTKEVNTNYVTPTPEPVVTPETNIFKITISNTRNNSNFVAFSEIRFYDNNQNFVNLSNYDYISTNASVYAGHKEDTVLDSNYSSYFKADFDSSSPIEIIFACPEIQTLPRYFSIVTSKESYDYDPTSIKIEYKKSTNVNIGDYTVLFNISNLSLPKGRCKNSDLIDVNYVPPTPVPEGYIPLYDANWNLFNKGGSTESLWIDDPNGIHLGSRNISYTDTDIINKNVFKNGIISVNGEFIEYNEDLSTQDKESIANHITTSNYLTIKNSSLTICAKINGDSSKNFRMSYYFYDENKNYILSNNSLNTGVFVNVFINDNESIDVPIVNIPINAKYFRLSIENNTSVADERSITTDIIDNCELYYGYNEYRYYTNDISIFTEGDIFDNNLDTNIYNLYKVDLLSTKSISSIRCDLVTNLDKNLQFKVYLFDKDMNYLEDLIESNNLNEWKDNFSSFNIVDDDYIAKYISVAIRFSDNSNITLDDIINYRLVFEYTDTYLVTNNKSICYAETKSTYDITDIDRLSLSVYSSGNNHSNTIIYLTKNSIFNSSDKSYKYDHQKYIDNNINTNTIVNMDVKSLKGNYYIGIANFYGNDFSFYNINKTDIVHEVKSSLKFTVNKLRDDESSNISLTKIKFYDINKNEIDLSECYTVTSTDSNIAEADIRNLVNNSITTFSSAYTKNMAFTFNYESIIQKPYYITITTNNLNKDEDIVSFTLEYSSNKGVSYETLMQLSDVEMPEDRNKVSDYFYIGYYKPTVTPEPGPDDPEPEPVVVVTGWIPFTQDNWNLFNTDKTGYLCRSEFTNNYELYLKNVQYKNQSHLNVTAFEQGDYDINGSKYNSNTCIRTSNYITIPNLTLTYSITSKDTNDEFLVNTVCFLDGNKNIIKNELCGIADNDKNYSVPSNTALLIPKEAKYLRYSIKYLNNSNITPSDLKSSVINWNDNADNYKETDLKELDWYLSAIDLIHGKVNINDTSSNRYLSLWHYVKVPENAIRLCVELKSLINESNVKWFIYCYDSNNNYIYSDECSTFINNNTYMELPKLDDLAYVSIVSNYTVTQDYLKYGRLTFELSEPDTQDILYNVSYAETKSKVDLTTLESINVNIDTQLENSYIYVSKTPMIDNPTSFMPHRLLPITTKGNNNVVFNVNSLQGDYYIGFAATNNSEITINAIDKSDLIIDTTVEPVDMNRYLDLLSFDKDWLVGTYADDGEFVIDPTSNELICNYYVPIVNSNIVIGAIYENISNTPSTKRKVFSKVCYYTINKTYFSETEWCEDTDSEYNYTRYVAPEGTMYYKVILRVVGESNVSASYLDCKIYFDEIINMDNLYIYNSVYAITPKDNLSYIDTGIKPGFNKEVEIKFANLKWDSNFILGAIDNWPNATTDIKYLLANNTANEPSDHKLNIKWYHHYDENVVSNFEINNNEEYIIRIRYTPIIINDDVLYYNVSIYLNDSDIPIITDDKVPYDFDFENISTITLFNYLSSSTSPASVIGTNAGSYELRSFIIRDTDNQNKKLVEYIPILDYNGVPCLFDLINHKYIYNANYGGQGFNVIDEPLPVELRMPEYAGIKGIYHLKSFTNGVWKNTLGEGNYLNNITFVGNVIKGTEELIIPANNYTEVNTSGFSDFNENFTMYIIARLDDISIKYSNKNLFNTNLLKKSSYFTEDRTSYNITYNLEPNTYYVLSCNIPYDSTNDKATICIGESKCYDENHVVAQTNNDGELVITMNNTDFYNNIITTVDNETQINYEIQLEKGNLQTGQDAPTTYEPFVLPNNKKGIILSTLTVNGGFELSITDRSDYDKPNLITLRDNTHNVIAGLITGGIDSTEYHLYTIVGRTVSNTSTIELYVDGKCIINNFTYTKDSTNTKINICKSIDSEGNVIGSDHITNIKFMAFGVQPHTVNMIRSNIKDEGNLIDMYNITKYIIPDYTITELYNEDFINKNITCVNGIENIVDSEFHFTNGTIVNIPANTKTFTVKNRFGNKLSLPFYALVYDSSNNIIDVTDSYKSNEELCFLPTTNASKLKIVINKGTTDSGNLLYTDIIWNKSNKKYNIVDNLTWDKGTISTVNGSILPSNSIIRTDYITIPDNADSLMFEGVMKDASSMQHTIFAYDNDYNYVNSYNNLITNGFEWRENNTITDLLFNTQKNIKYIRIIAQKTDTDINTSDILNTKLIFMSRNDVLTLNSSDWQQYDGSYGSTYTGNFEEPINTVTVNNSLYYKDTSNSGYIDITDAKYIVLNTTLNNNDVFKYAIYFYNENKEHIDINHYVSYWIGDMNIINISGTVFANAKYIRILLKSNDDITVSNVDTSYITIVKNNINDIIPPDDPYYDELNDDVTSLETDTTSSQNRLTTVENSVSDLTDDVNDVNNQTTAITNDLEYLIDEPFYVYPN